MTPGKTTLTVLAICCVCFGTSCLAKKNFGLILQGDSPYLDKNIPENTDAKDYVIDPSYDVYVTGESFDDNNANYIRGYWKNGVWQEVPGTGFLDNVANIFADSNNVYACGHIQISSGYSQAVYWKNGSPVVLSGVAGELATAKAITVYNGDVYTAGYKLIDPNNIVGIVWKNQNVLFTFPNEGISDMRVINGAIYTVGDIYSGNMIVANVVYKDSVRQFQTPSSEGGTYNAPFDVNGSGFVLAGRSNDYFIGNSQHLNINNTRAEDGSILNAIHINGNGKILLAGRCTVLTEDGLNNLYAGLWRDGYFDRLESRYQSELTDVTAVSGKEFLAGNIFDQSADPLYTTDLSHAVLWIDNDRYKLTAPHKYCRTGKMFVLKK